VIKLSSLSSWLGVVFLLLLFFTAWYFLLRDNRSEGSSLLPSKVCKKEYPRESQTVSSWKIFYYNKGCAKIEDSNALIAIASWLRDDTDTITKDFDLPSLDAESALLLTRKSSWETLLSSSSAPAIITLGENSPLARHYLNSALINIALQEKYKGIKNSRKISESLSLSLTHNRYLDINSPLSQTREELIDLLRSCQDKDCLSLLQQDE
jgi:hypothetical protein